MYDYHMHSNFSGDCSTPMEDMVKEAMNKGLKEICFTDHVDLDHKDPNISFDEIDQEKYHEAIFTLKNKYQGQISIKKGIELGVQPHILDDYHQLVKDYYFDFIIASIHTCGERDIHHGGFFEGKTPKQAYQEYYEDLYYHTKNFEDFSVIGHMDLLKRYSQYATPPDSSLYFDIFEMIFKELIHNGKGIEVNTSGLRKKCKETLPSKKILELYFQMGGEIITLGSDSHFPETLAYAFDEVMDLLKNIGFRYIATFENKKPGFIKI